MTQGTFNREVHAPCIAGPLRIDLLEVKSRSSVRSGQEPWLLSAMNPAEASGGTDDPVLDLSQSTLQLAPSGPPVILGPTQHLPIANSSTSADMSNPNPFWSEHMQAEYELARARPRSMTSIR